jgi:hypothetical protein
VESFAFSYIGDGDTKTMLKLSSEPPYPDVVVQKIEDINHWCKNMYDRLEKKKNEMKNIAVDGKKGISGAGRLTESKTLALLFIYSNVVLYVFLRYDSKFQGDTSGFRVLLLCFENGTSASITELFSYE